MLAEKAILDSHPTFTYHTFSAEFVSAVYLLMATIGRQQQQQKGKGSGDTRCPDKAASIRVFPPKKSVISPMNFSKVMEWYLQRHTHWDRNSNVQHQRTVDGITVSYYSILVNNCGRWGLVLKCTKQQEKKKWYGSIQFVQCNPSPKTPEIWNGFENMWFTPFKAKIFKVAAKIN